METGNTRRKKGRCVGVKRRSGIIKRRTELDMLCLGEKESNNFSPNNDSAQTSRGRSHCTHSCVFFVVFFFILSTHASDGRYVAFLGGASS